MSYDSHILPQTCHALEVYPLVFGAHYAVDKLTTGPLPVGAAARHPHLDFQLCHGDPSSELYTPDRLRP